MKKSYSAPSLNTMSGLKPLSRVVTCPALSAMVADPLPMGILMTQAPLTQVFQCVNSSPDLKDELICVATPHEGTQEEDVRMSVRVMLWYSRIKKMRAAAAITTATLDD